MSALWHGLAEPWRDAIMQRALIEVVLLSVSGGALGCWVVLYEATYSAESLPHAMFPGLVVAALAGLPLVLGGAAGLLVAALAVALAGRLPGVGRDTGVAVVVTTLFGLGVLLALAPDSPPGVQSLLFGDVLAITGRDLALAGGLALAVAAGLRLLHTRLLTAGFDRGSARALGAPPVLADAALLSLLAVAVLVAVPAMGNLLVVAVLIAPAAAARLRCRRLGPMMATATALAMVAGTVGLYASYHLRTAAGASIAVAMVLCYLLVAAVGRRAELPSGARPGSPAPDGGVEGGP